jgi:predicted RecB family nuclease
MTDSPISGRKVNGEIIESYLRCRRKGGLLLAGERGSKSDYELLLNDTRECARTAASSKVISDSKEAVPSDLRLTVPVLRRGFAHLLNATLEDEHVSIRFDGLRRVAGPSMLGDFHYLPMLFHASERQIPELKALLEVLAEPLAVVQGRRPAWAVLVGGRECRTRRIKLATASTPARRTLDELSEMRVSMNLPSLRLNRHCQTCEFRARCHSEAQSRDDLSLLRGIGEKQIDKYNRRGIFTVTQLSCTFRATKRTFSEAGVGRAFQPALKALALREKKVYVLGRPALPVSPGRIFFDIEGDSDRSLAYLLGMIVERDGVEQARHSFWLDDAESEAQLFARFMEVVSAYPDYTLYSYGSYETAFLRRMAKASGRPSVLVELLARSHNVLSTIRSHVYVPTYSNGLKDVARLLGFTWTAPDASGIQSVVWRRRWEAERGADLQQKLVEYNIDDCEALKRVTGFVYTVCDGSQTATGQSRSTDGIAPPIVRVEEVESEVWRFQWRTPSFAIDEFGFVNKRAYFDYQQDKVFVRTSRELDRQHRRQVKRKGRKKLRASRTTALAATKCSACGGDNLTWTPDARLARFAMDLAITPSGIRRKVVRYTTHWYRCRSCRHRFLPDQYLHLEEHCHALKSWGMYEHVAYRAPFAGIAERLQECYGLPVSGADVSTWQVALSRRYDSTLEQIRNRLVGGPVIHADETEAYVRRLGKAYVWVFASLDSVLYVLRPTREAAFLSEFLSGYRGVLVSDFYGGYDSLECEQQRCLIHLMRDFNEDILRSPWDEELKGLGSRFGALLRAVVSTIDRYGLKRRHLKKHQREVNAFFAALPGDVYRSELAEGYRKRMLRWQGKLFTFIQHDGVPWNNNNAEHAIKRFAKYRTFADGSYTEKGLNEYLALLSLYVTCKFRRISFLKFLLSKQTDLDAFSQGKASRLVAAEPELYTGAELPRRPSRRQTLHREVARRQAAAGRPTIEPAQTGRSRRAGRRASRSSRQ